MDWRAHKSLGKLPHCKARPPPKLVVQEKALQKMSSAVGVSLSSELVKVPGALGVV